MRYRRGMIALSEVRDYPLLRRVLHSSFVTPAQLYEFMRLDYCASSRNAFDNRLRRLLAHDLLVRHEIQTMNRGVVDSISRAGASVSIEVFRGNTQDPKTFAAQVKKASERFGCERVTFVGDRGMIKSGQVEDLAQAGFHYITAITKPQIDTLIEARL